MKESTKARIAVLVANFFFGTTVIAVKHISPLLIQPFALTTVRIVICTLLFWMMYAVKPVRMGFTRKDYARLFLCAIAGILLNQTFTMFGMSLTSPIHTSLLVLITPINITLLAAFFLKESLNGLKLLGLALGIAGGAILVFSRDLSSKAGSEQSLGDLFIILGAISYSVYVISIKPLMHQYKASHILQWVFLFGCMLSLPLGWKSVSEVNWGAFDGLSWFCIAYVVLGSTFLAYQLMNYSISKLGAGVSGSYMYTQPFFTTLAAMILLHETLSLPKVGAAVLIMTGVFLTNYKRKNQ